ncbi:hypothetical protein BX666DRAFT_1991275 [Dichotomocladium elegans]|nr:hypothetical protein BX666DRAFT_1991275 [Dichotomocladium elegans]
MVSLFWGQSALDELIEKATSELLPAGQENLPLHFEISDQIRSKKVNSKDAMRSLKRRLEHKNPNVLIATLSLVDTCVKNGGDQFVREVSSREFMDPLTGLLRSPVGSNLDVKNKILTIIQTWHLASNGNPSLSYISDTYRLLQAEGYVFPPVSQTVDSILLETSAPPEWSDSDVCERCRTPFTITNRKHHCRCCGKTFCQDCSGKTMPLPHIGIEDEVRVCDGCYIKLKLSKVAKKDTLPPFPTASQPRQSSREQPSRSTQQGASSQNDDDLDEDMKKAIELSLKEAEQFKSGYGAGYTPSKPPQSTASAQVGSNQTVSKTAPAVTAANEEEDDPELAAAIAASLREMQIASPAKQSNRWNESIVHHNPDDISRTEMENIELFSTLIARIHARGGDISNDPQISNLYSQIGALQPKLVKTLQAAVQRHQTFVELHEKMNAAVRAYDHLLEQRVAGANNRASQSYAPYFTPNLASNVASAPAPSPSHYSSSGAPGYEYTTQSFSHQQQPQASMTNGYPSISPAATAPEYHPGMYAQIPEPQQQQQPYPQLYPQASSYYYHPTPSQQNPYPYQTLEQPQQQQQQQHQQQQQQQQQHQQQSLVEDTPLIDLS